MHEREPRWCSLAVAAPGSLAAEDEMIAFEARLFERRFEARLRCPTTRGSPPLTPESRSSRSHGFGNTSAPTVLFLLRRVLEHERGTLAGPCLVFPLGPGFAVEFGPLVP